MNPLINIALVILLSAIGVFFIAFILRPNAMCENIRRLFKKHILGKSNDTNCVTGEGGQDE